ncbi:MAG: hypothetical protein CMO01_20775, partial [Thalassobius sp.]|nr:hypothetical protein [Thalassovita sp.]
MINNLSVLKSTKSIFGYFIFFILVYPYFTWWTSLFIIIFFVFVIFKDGIKIINPYFGFICFFLISLVSFLYTDHLYDSVKIIEKKLPFVFLSFIFSALKFSDKQLQVLKYVFLISVVFMILKSSIVAIEFYNRPTEHFTLIHLPHALSSMSGFHAPYYSLYISFSSFIAISLFLECKNLRYIIIYILLLGFNFLLSSRMGLFCQIFSTIFIVGIIAIKNKAYYYIVLIVITFTSLFVLSYHFLPRMKDRIDNFSKFNNGSERIMIWDSAFNIIKKYPVLGVSDGNLSYELNETYKSKKYKELVDSGLNIHNQYLHQFAANGILGFLFIILFFSYLFYRYFKSSNYLGVMGMISIILASCTEVLFARQKGILIFCFI